jgi:ribosome biogenesis GTPase A
VNSLARKAILPIYSTSSSSRGPTTTEHAQELIVEAGAQSIRFIDTPGLTWVSDDSSEHLRARDILLRSKGRIDRLKDPSPPGKQEYLDLKPEIYLTRHISRTHREKLQCRGLDAAIQSSSFYKRRPRLVPRWCSSLESTSQTGMFRI